MILRYKNVFILTLFLVISVFSVNAHAARSSVSIMTPRNTVKHLSEENYSYGYTYLPGDALDAYETIYRKVSWPVNYDFLDKRLLRPISVVYVDYVPQCVRNCVSNILSNLREPNNVINNMLVARPLDSGISLSRFAINSTIGVLGCFDVAESFSLENKKMTFGTVLGKWGVQQGGYLVIPGLGVTTYREYIGTYIDDMMFLHHFIPWWQIAILAGIEAVDTRSEMLQYDDLLSNSLDPYSQMRDFYLLNAEKQVSGKIEMAPVEEATPEDLESFMDEIDE